MVRKLKLVCLAAVAMLATGAWAATTLEPGLTSEFYKFSTDLTDFPTDADLAALVPDATSVDGTINYPETGNSFPGSSTNQNFYVRWSGIIRVAPPAGTYVFYLNSNDGSRLYIDGALVIENDGVRDAMSEVAGITTLTAGDHEVTVDMFENVPSWGCIFSWESATMAKSVVPSTVLFHLVNAANQGVQITSPLGATGAVGVPFQYTLTATGLGTLVASVSDLPAGLALSGMTISGTPTAAGTYPVTLFVTNGSDFDRETLALTVVVPSLDTDGDGFPDGLEVAAGTDPYYAGSAPASSSGVPQPFSLSRLQVKLGGAGSDVLSVSGTLPVAHSGARASFGGLRAIIDVGGVVVTANLDGKASDVTAQGPVSFRVQGNKRGVQNASFKCQLKGNFLATLSKQGLNITADSPKAAKQIYVYILVNNTLYGQTANLGYSVKSAKGTGKLLPSGVK